MKPILSVDFDGVIHSFVSGWIDIDQIPDAPVPGAFEFLRAAAELFDVQIFSSRNREPRGIAAMQLWFLDNGWPGSLTHGPTGLSFPTDKPAAFVTLDDRAINFAGKFPSVKSLREFEPWYLRKNEEAK